MLHRKIPFVVIANKSDKARSTNPEIYEEYLQLQEIRKDHPLLFKFKIFFSI